MADVPVDALLLRAEDLTKGWLLALLEQAPLQDAPAILAANSVSLIREGPRVCEAVVRALADDGALRRIEPGGALEPLMARAGDLTGSAGPEAISQAVDALQAVIWSALRDELPRPDADQVSELAERLTMVTELVRAAALRRGEGVVVQDVRRREPEVAPPVGGPEVEVDSDPVREPRRTPESAGGSVRGLTGDGEHPRPRMVPWPPEPEPAPAPRVADALWIGAVEEEIGRSVQTGGPLSLVLIELDESERVMTVEPPGQARTTFGRFAQSVRTVVRRQDILACESETRAWIIARDTARSGAQALADRIAGAVRLAEPWRGAPLTVSAGVAVLGEDGSDAASLIDAAEEAKFAAAASGLSVMPDPPEREEDHPAG